MSDLYFNDKRFVGHSKISDIFFLLPAIMWYMEHERWRRVRDMCAFAFFSVLVIYPV